MQTGGDTGEEGAAFGTGLITNSDDAGEASAGFENVENGFGLVAGNVDTDFLHGFHDDGIDLSGFEPRAGGFKLLAADSIQEGLRHLAAGAVVDTNEQNFFLHG